MSKQQAVPQSPAPTPDSSTSTASAATAAPATSTPQDLVGNQAVAQSLPAPASETSLLDTLAGPSHEAAHDAPTTQQGEIPTQRGPGDAIPTQRGPGTSKSKASAGAASADAPVSEVSRPSKVRKGNRGALIGGGGDITLTSEAGGGSTVATVPDGSGCKVTEVGGGSIKVKVRSGKKNVEGWCAASLFSDQPALGQDEDDPKLSDPYAYHKFENGPNMTPGEHPKGSDTAQGYLGDCFLISSLAAVTNADPDFAKGIVKYDEKKKRYLVRFFEEQERGKRVPVTIEVDGFLPTVQGDPKDPAYAGDAGAPLWGAIVEKAYAKWKGGYDKVGEGGTGDEAMAELTGASSKSKSPSAMSEKEVLPYFKKAKQDGLAIYAGTRDSVKGATQTPLHGTGSGPYTGNVKQDHEWDQIAPGSLKIDDKGGNVAEAHDDGEEGTEAPEADIVGADVASGHADLKGNSLELTYKKGKAPKKGEDLSVSFQVHGVLDPGKMIIGDHGYAFIDVVDGDKLQFYNPWGTYQPKPITAAEFLRYYDALSTNAVPKGK